MQTPYLAPFSLTSDLRIVPALNGGWVVYEGQEHSHLMPKMIGAFSNGQDLCSAITSALAPTQEPTP
jgi:hypothetical protein